MVIMFWMLITFGIIGAIITLCSVLHNLDVADMMPIYRTRKKKVGAAFWGSYEGSLDESPETIGLPKITFNSEALAGSELYSKGRAVKSANARR